MLFAEAGNEANCMTTAEVETAVKRLSYVLRHEFGIGSSPGKDVVTCLSSNNLLLPTVFLATIGAGGVYSAASSALTVAELTRQIQTSGSKLVITTEDLQETAVEAARSCSIPPERILILHRMDAQKRALTSVANPIRNYLQQGSNELPRERITDLELLKSRTAALIFSSGTTGPPKGVKLSHRNFVGECVIAQAAMRAYLDRTKQRYIDYEHRTIAHLPCAHISGLQGYILNNIMYGGTVFWMPKFIFEDFVIAARQHRPTFLTTVPAVFLRIAKSLTITDEFHSLKQAQSGAAPIGRELQRLAETKLTCRIGQAWGLTETTGAVTALPWDEIDDTGSIGKLLPNTRMKIVGDDDSTPVPDGSAGEILIRGPNVTSGYWNNPEGTREALTEDGWLRTGDIGLRRNGKFYIVDRKKVSSAKKRTAADHSFSDCSTLL